MRSAVVALSLGAMSCAAAAASPDGPGYNQMPDSTGDCPALSGSASAAGVGGPPMPALTLDQCRACHGDWGRQGIAEIESCDCGTCDGGKRCTDGADCQGMCIANADHPAYDIIDAGPPARGFLVGSCSDLITVFGCNALVEAGARAHGPVLVIQSPEVLCLD